MNNKKKQTLFKLTAKDFEFSYFRGSGKGGQKRNKTSNAVRCYHKPSGAVGKCEDGRSQKLNKSTAFKRMTETPEFKQWVKIECSRKLGQLEDIGQKVERELKENVKLETHDDKGRWVETKVEDLDKDLAHGDV